ncbi:MAG TPA: hypothetical protein VJS12_09725 [Steroidobacteraceae bacterium]|nr:hypothetical protein [Steroidobacteraceae bacterium]
MPAIVALTVPCTVTATMSPRAGVAAAIADNGTQASNAALSIRTADRDAILND